uniref:Fam-b protein n=1 Tax=Strongyloides venezuelensis TaxID=75913 RepID=A0A0K0FEZ7_STRVS
MKCITIFFLIFLFLNPTVRPLEIREVNQNYYGNLRNDNKNDMHSYDISKLNNDFGKPILLDDKIDLGLLDYINEINNSNKDIATHSYFDDLKRLLEIDNFAKKNLISKKYSYYGKRSHIPGKYIGLGKRSIVNSDEIKKRYRKSGDVEKKFSDNNFRLIGLGKRSLKNDNLKKFEDNVQVNSFKKNDIKVEDNTKGGIPVAHKYGMKYIPTSSRRRIGEVKLKGKNKSVYISNTFFKHDKDIDSINILIKYMNVRGN